MRVVQLIFRHISGARATEVDVVPLGAHRELILGRAPSAAVRFDSRRDVTVGRHHARIVPRDDSSGRFVLMDLASRNGTFLNGCRIEGAADLNAGDIVQLGAEGPVVEVIVETVLGPTPD
jgi:pSer/pThr/pTyr-binding forkhead associated (FHA) protein